jgi:hypothetical protein
VGDLAFCAGACQAHDGCSYASGMFCFDVGLLGDPTVGVGYCAAAEPCPQGMCSRPDETCTTTSYGPVCLQVQEGTNELLIPLGEAGQGG